MAVETLIQAQLHEHARQWETTTLKTEVLLACGLLLDLLRL